ncbi:MAG: serine/threonine protein phosphatase [Tindallia sp. MSAO_Bac2]|nr:MAG: serine/threonine protein phosphatase [Tindallia sp. MSAO_Bac2]
MIYGIGDLHLSHSVEKPMSIFGKEWVDHQNKIKNNWEKIVLPEDAVLIPGDISWAMTMEEAWEDLLWIENLPGKKYLIRGNHDYWWKSITKMNQAFDSLHFIQNQFFPYKNYAICGARGWILPGSGDFEAHDEKILTREKMRLEASLKSAAKAGYDQIIVMIHYPPMNEKKEPSHFTRLIEQYNVKKVVYGHLHGEDSWSGAYVGWFGGAEYKLISSDYLNFKPALII